MKPALNNDDLAILYAIHQPVFAVDASGPATGKVVSQRFRFADAGEGGGLDGFD